MASDNDVYSIELRGAGGLTLRPSVTAAMRIGELKELVARNAKAEEEQVRLLFKGAALIDERTLSDYSIGPNAVIHVNISRSGAGTIGSARDASEQLDEQERMMSNMMAMPGMKAMLENPEFIRNMLCPQMNSNPKMKEVFEKNPEFKAALKDDSTMKMISQTMTNPSMRKEMMRNMDRAMANIETMPGGWDALQRVYHSFQEPMMDAVTPADRSTPSNSTPAAEEKGPTNSAMPNPWQRNQRPQNPFGANPFGGMNMNPMGSPWAANPNPYASLFGQNPYGLPNPLFTVPAPVPAAPAAPVVEEDYNVKYKSILQELEEMGFTDKSANLAAAIEADGDLDKAITILFPDPNEKNEKGSS